MVDLLIQANANIHIKTPMNGNTLLHEVALLGNRAIAQTLLEHGLNVNSLNNQDITPIWNAVKTSDIDMAKLYSSFGAELDIPCTFGFSLLMFAIEKNNPEMVSFLIERCRCGLQGC